MGKFYGKVGYVDTVEYPERSGIYKYIVTERNYYGDFERRQSKWQTNDNLNDDIVINQRISILADAYAYQNFSLIRYVEWMGVKWKVESIEVGRPRLTLSIGGEYNGEQNHITS